MAEGQHGEPNRGVPDELADVGLARVIRFGRAIYVQRSGAPDTGGIGDVRSRRAETKAWSSDVSGAQRGVDWQMKIGDARCKLASVYPRIKL